jgi:hypothetical protein
MTQPSVTSVSKGLVLGNGEENPSERPRTTPKFASSHLHRFPKNDRGAGIAFLCRWCNPTAYPNSLSDRDVKLTRSSIEAPWEV